MLTITDLETMQNKRTTARRDLLLIAMLTIVAYLVAGRLDLSERLYAWERAYEQYDVDEVFIVALLLSFGAVIFSWRRWQELRREVVASERADQERNRIAEEFRRVTRMLPHVIFMARKHGNGDISLVFNEGAIAEDLGLTTDVVAGRSLQEVFPPDLLEVAVPAYERAFSGEQVKFRSYLGERVYNNVARPLTADREVPLTPVEEIGGCVTDITERTQYEEQLAHRAFHDPLTDLPNRALFLDRLEQAIARGNRTGRVCALLFLDLDNLKKANDSFGHEAGDRVLVEVSRRLLTVLRAEDTLARLAGDEFTVLVEDLDDPMEAVRVAERLERQLTEPLQVARQQICVTASIGIAYSTSGRTQPGELLRNADTAMYMAKNSGKARHEVFTHAPDTPYS